MRDTYLDSLLGEHEKIILVTHQHWLLLAQKIVVEIFVMAVIFALVTAVWVIWLPNPLVVLGYFLLIFPLISLLRDVLVWENHKYVVTNRRVVQIFGVINKNVTDSSLEKVNDVKMEQSFFGRMFNYGDIEILTASEMGINRFTRIGRPVRFKTAMLNAKEKMESERTVQEAPPPVDIPALIAELDALHQKGALTEEEFKAKKAELLARL